MTIDVLDDIDPLQPKIEPPKSHFLQRTLVRISGDNNVPDPRPPQYDALFALLPLLIVISTFLFLLLLFLLCIVLVRRRRGIALGDNDGPVDVSREDAVHGDGGFEGVESRWLESVTEPVRRSYLRAKDYQLQYPPNSLPTDITLSQFLSIQEKGVSAWSFEPDYETVNSLLVHSRTEITFLPDPASSSCVLSNLPLPKLNEVYYWEVKMFDLPQTTTVAVGLATKPYPPFRLPGLCRYSVAYHSSGDKSYNYPFTSSPFGPSLKEGDVLGIGYRPRTGAVFFTRNGRKLEDAFIGLSRWNLFPTIGADGPCSVHVNFGQSGFVFIEANVKKWGLAPSVGTLAPPPAYGSERGSILLDVGGGVRSMGGAVSPLGSPAPSTPRRSRRHRRPRNNQSPVPVASSPLRTSSVAPEPLTPPPPITPIDEEPDNAEVGPSTSRRYISPTDSPFHSSHNTNLPATPGGDQSDQAEDQEVVASHVTSSSSSDRSPSPADAPGARNPFSTPRHQPHSSLTHFVASLSDTGSELVVQVHSPPDSPRSPNPPTPHPRDIHLQALSRSNAEYHHEESSGSDLPAEVLSVRDTAFTRQEPPAYSPLDAYTYAEGVHIDLPAEFITAALEGSTPPTSSLGQANTSRLDRRRSRRR